MYAKHTTAVNWKASANAGAKAKASVSAPRTINAECAQPNYNHKRLQRALTPNVFVLKVTQWGDSQFSPRHEHGSKCRDAGLGRLLSKGFMPGKPAPSSYCFAPLKATREQQLRNILLATPPPVLPGISRPLSAARPYAYGTLCAPACTYPREMPQA